MADALQGLPGATFGFSQYIQDNVQAASGIDAENAIKITGPDLDTLRKIAVKSAACSKVRGIPDIQVPPLLGQPTIRIDIDRQRAALRPVAR
jgi:cobalt-zinc-cadmium resistance protein CzcA